MASLDFPSNPTNGQTYALNGVTYYYNSSMGAWLTQLTSMNIASSSNTQVLFNDAGIANGSTGLVFNKAANTVTANTVVATGTHTLVQVPNYRNTPYINADYTVSNTYNEMSIGPINIANGVSVTVDNNANWVIV